MSTTMLFPVGTFRSFQNLRVLQLHSKEKKKKMIHHNDVARGNWYLGEVGVCVGKYLRGKIQRLGRLKVSKEVRVGRA